MRRALLSFLIPVVAAAALAPAASAGVSPVGAKTGTATSAVTIAGATCAGASVLGSFSSPGGPPPVVISTDLLPVFPSPATFLCTRTPGLRITFGCTNTGTITLTGRTVAGVTPLTITSLSCIATLTGSPTCTARISGGVSGSFDNATSALTIATTGQTLTVSGTTCSTVFANGATTWTASGGTAATYTISPATTINY
jgi:hypothetical protein